MKEEKKRGAKVPVIDYEKLRRRLRDAVNKVASGQIMLEAAKVLNVRTDDL